MGIYDREYYKSESRTNNSRTSSSNERINQRMDHEEAFIKTAQIGMGIVAGTVVITTAAAVGLGVYLIKKLCD